ncbi:DNA replication ATPase [Metarhizium album ARSEF 1941]|uniref:DNA replication ATPase n=1 Tax=Metarhizium album (strain ARSEF 1941) TaxID=1081103 RepID=A0A0B2WWI8_METAS|nr:DNA replication ATPase [Metarhizium album ARSEF 1941]KHN97762.1 DNA replication ATPase [Metarhizium album ARSEF 1941]
MAVDCPICNKPVRCSEINSHIDSGCTSFVVDKDPGPSPPPTSQQQNGASHTPTPSQRKRSASSFFSTPAPKRAHPDGKAADRPVVGGTLPPVIGKKRSFEEGPGADDDGTGPGPSAAERGTSQDGEPDGHGQVAKRTRTVRPAPLAERMRPTTLDQVCGQDIVGPNGVLRGLIEARRVPSMILWGASGTGKTTIARCIARAVGSRLVEVNATSAGVAECKKLLHEAARELGLTGRATVVFCDEMHRFSRAQQDVFLQPVEAGTVTLIGATTENPSFRITGALLSRCRTFTLQPLTAEAITGILRRARAAEAEGAEGAEAEAAAHPAVDDDMLAYLARLGGGDARAALNLLELALSLAARGGDALTKHDVKASLARTLVHDGGGDQHYDCISAFHKSVRGGDPDAALYYLARMLQSGEDPLFVARRMVVIASEDVGLADNALLPLAVAAYTATQQIGMPEARIPLAHCAVALCLAPKSTRAYRGLNNACAALREPGVAALPVPAHLRNAPTRLARDPGLAAGLAPDYKYPPNYRDGRVRQAYLPAELAGRTFLEERHLGTEIDPDLVMDEAE